MKYIALIYGNDEIWGSVPPARWREIVDEVDAFNRRLRASGELVAVDGLVSRPRAVRAPEGVPVVSDGPYLEAKEHVGSYFVLDVDSEQRAVEIVKSYRRSARKAVSSCGRCSAAETAWTRAPRSKPSCAPRRHASLPR